MRKLSHFYKKSLELFIELLGEEHPSVAEALNNLGMFYTNQEKYEFGYSTSCSIIGDSQANLWRESS